MATPLMVLGLPYDIPYEQSGLVAVTFLMSLGMTQPSGHLIVS